MIPARPNILLIMADQLSASALGAYGNDIVHAPNIDALAARSVIFDRAYCASPLCAPSRSAMLTGSLPSEIGTYDNGAELAADTPSVTHALRASGYGTTLSGKMHFVGPDQLHGFEERLTSDVYPADFDWTPDWTLAPEERLPWYHNMASLRAAGVVEAAMQTDYDDEVGFRAVQKLRDLSRGADERPFFLVASFTNPHDPWEVRQRHWDLYDGVRIPPPRVPAIPREAVDGVSRRLRDMYQADLDPLDIAETGRARRAYYAAVSYVDDRVGDLLAVLDETRRTDDTVVILTSDHGEMLGERGLWYKMSFFEPSVRVPLLVSGPGLDSARVGDPVSQLDLAPTLAELAGAAWDGGGRSLTSHLAGGRAASRPVFSEYLAEGVEGPSVMVREGSHKLIRSWGDTDQLYDLVSDPDELNDLASDPGSAGVLARLSALASTRWDLEGLRDRVLASQARRRMVCQALSRGAYTPWDYEPRSDASRLYVRSPGAARPRPWELRPAGGLPGEEPG